MLEQFLIYPLLFFPIIYWSTSMKKLTISIAIAFIALCNISTAQEVRLDSLWAKRGGVTALSFSQDSKHLLIADDLGLATIYDAATGIKIDTIERSGYYDVSYSPDGKRIIMDSYGGFIRVYSAATFRLEKKIPCIYGGYINFSPNPDIVVFAGPSHIAVVDIESGELKAHISRPDKYNTAPNKYESYFNGKVCFSADGKYIIGKYANILVQWDWRNTPDKPEQLIPNLPNRAIIGFSPGKTLFVQQSNNLWSIAEKKQILIDGFGGGDFTENGFGCAFTTDSQRIFCTQSTQAVIVNISQRKRQHATGFSVGNIAVSSDSKLFALHGAGNYSKVYRINWEVNSVETEPEISPKITVSPLPGQENIRIEVQIPYPYPDCHIWVTSSAGAFIREIYRGDIGLIKQTFMFPTTEISSGQYSVLMSYGGKTTSIPFIITK